jgi:hypothetical protein
MHKDRIIRILASFAIFAGLSRSSIMAAATLINYSKKFHAVTAITIALSIIIIISCEPLSSADILSYNL